MNDKLKDDEKLPENIPYIVFEGEMTRLERMNKKLFTLLIIALIALALSNIGWIIYESQFQDEVITSTQTVTQDTGSEGGTNTFTGDFFGGDYNGKADDQKNYDN